MPEIPEHAGPPVADTESDAAPPPPPGTEPLLPIPSVSKSPEKESDTTQTHAPERREHDEDYGGDYRDYDDYEEDRRPRERHRSYSKEGQRERLVSHLVCLYLIDYTTWPLVMHQTGVNEIIV